MPCPGTVGRAELRDAVGKAEPGTLDIAKLACLSPSKRSHYLIGLRELLAKATKRIGPASLVRYRRRGAAAAFDGTLSWEATMAHELMHDHMAYVEEVPWHGLGKEVSSNVTAQEMITAAGLDWEVKKVPAPGARDDGKGRYNRYLVIRERTAHEPEDVVLGVVGHGYQVLQNDKAFEFFEPFIASRAAGFETAGALRDGERVWVLTKLADQIHVIGDDVVDRYLLLSNSHDGRGAVSIRFTPVRVVCQNTLSLATKGGSATIHVRHTRRMYRRLDQAQQEKLGQVIEATFQAATALFRTMAEIRLTNELRTAYLEHVFPRTGKQRAETLNLSGGKGL